MAFLFALLQSLVVGDAATGQVKLDKGVLMAELAYQMAGEMDKGIHERRREIQIFASLDQIRNPRASLDHKRDLLEKLQSTYPNYAWIGITDSQGNILAGTGKLLEGKNVAKREWFTQGSKGPHVGDVHDAFLLAKLLPKPQHDFLPLRLLDVSAPILDDEGRLLGVLCGHLSWDWAFQVRNSLLEPLREHGKVDVLILNQAGKILLGTPELAQLAQTASLPSFQAASSRKNGFITEAWPDGKEYLTGFAASHGHQDYTGLGWTVLVRQDTEPAFAAAWSLRQQTFWVAILVSGLFMITLWMLVGRLVRPMRTIAAAAEGIRGGSSDTGIPVFPGQDETAQLSRSLHRLVEALKARESELQARNEQLKLAAQVFESSLEGIIITDANETILSVNRAFSEISGYTAQEAIGQTPYLFSSGRHDSSFYREMWDKLGQNRKWQGEIWNRRKNGEIYPEWLVITAVTDAAGHISHYIGVFADITERKQAEAHILHLAQHDGLTDLPNRLLLDDRLKQAILLSQRGGGKAAVLFIDLDRFKNINDSLGHDVGDRVLIEVGKRIQGCLRSGDTLARWGGDEFAVILPELKQTKEAASTSNRIIAALAEPFHPVEGYQLSITASIGISIYPDDGGDVTTLTRNADTALFHAKDCGRNTYQFFTVALNQQVHERLTLENALRGALKNSEFQLHYQPIVELASGRMVGVEALLRWQHPELGSVSPARFIPLAEETGLIHAIGTWVLREACAQQCRWLSESGQALRVSVNLSSAQFRENGIPRLVESTMRETGIDPRYLELEITESVIIDSPDVIAQDIEQLHAMGIRIAIDDFGTGYSSLSYLLRLAIDKIKIDQSFVRNLSYDADAAAIISAAITLARSIRVSVIAEGVETTTQLDFLRQLECEEAQGYLFARPMPAGEISKLLQAGQPLPRPEHAGGAEHKPQ